MTINKTTTAAKRPNDPLSTSEQGKKSREALLAEFAYDPAARSLPGAQGFIKGLLGERGLSERLDALMAQVNQVRTGNLQSVEKTLVAQANTLDAIFNELARRAALSMGEYLNTAETYLRLALKAQSQCRTTLETLAVIKNPQPVAFVRQANIAHGPQQVNNGAVMDASHARKSQNQPNKVLEQEHGERLDIGAKGAAGSTDSALETLGVLNRAEDEIG